MHRTVTLAASLILASVFAGYAEEPKPPSQRPKLPEGSKAEAERNPSPRVQFLSPQAIGVSTPWGAGKSAAEWYIERTDKVARLSDEQRQKITALFESRDKAIQEFQAAIAAQAKSVSAEMAEAFKSQDKELIAKTQKAYQELYAPMHDVMKKSETALQNVLTLDQKAKLHDFQITSLLTTLTAGVKLSEEQLKQIKAGTAQPSGDHEAWERKLPQLIDKTLTAEQLAAVLKQRLSSYATMLFNNAKLTPEQLKNIEVKVAELTKAHKQTAQLDPAIYQKLSEHINGLLTAEQKASLKAPRVWVATTTGEGGQPVTVMNLAPGAALVAPTTAHKPADAHPANVKVTQLPGGGFQIIVGEGGHEAKEGKAVQDPLEKMQRQWLEAIKPALTTSKTGMSDRVKRQHELTKKASRLLKKMDALREGDKAKAYELWEELERVEGQLRQTFVPPQVSFVPAQVSGARVGATPHPGVFGPGATIHVAPGTANLDVRSELQALSRQVEELRAEVQKLSKKTD